MPDTTNRIAGTAYLSVDGESYLLRGDFEYSPSARKRESVPGMDGVHGYLETINVPHMSGTLTDAGTLSVTDLNAMTNVTVVCELANGKTITGRNMWTVESQTSKATDGTVEVRWEGPEVVEA